MRGKQGNSNFFNQKARGVGSAGGFGQQENFVVGAENHNKQPPPEPFRNKGTALVNGNTVSEQHQSMSKSLIAAYKRAKQSGIFIFQSQSCTVFPSELANFADMTIPGENWWDGYDLTKVDVSNNLIQSIPEISQGKR